METCSALEGLELAEASVKVIGKEDSQVKAKDLLGPVAWKAGVVRGSVARVGMKTGPVFISGFQ